MEPILAILLFALAIWFVLWISVLVPYRMAVKRNREGCAWVLVSLLGSPFVAIFLLLVLGYR